VPKWDCHIILVTSTGKIGFLLDNLLVLTENLREIIHNRRVLVIILRVSLNNLRVLPINLPLLHFVPPLHPLRASHRESTAVLPDEPIINTSVQEPIIVHLNETDMLYMHEIWLQAVY
jgi:hypothetical protein